MTVYPRIISHRCGGRLAPENTLAGLDAAMAVGCRAVEFDVMLTRDRVPVLMHDETLARTTGLPGRLADIAFAELRAAAPHVPTLAEAIALCRRLGMWVNVELKPAQGQEALTGDIVGAWLAEHWEGKGVISSFSLAAARSARKRLPAAAFALLASALPADWRERCAEIGAIAVHLAARHVTRRTAADLGEAGVPWACYTVNSRRRAERLFSLGCAAIFTDRPELWTAEEKQAAHA